MKHYILFILGGIILLTSCGKRGIQSNATNDTNSLQHDTNFKETTTPIEQAGAKTQNIAISIEDFSISNDTLTVLTTGDFMDYPFGKYNTIKELNHSIGGTKTIKKIGDNTWLDSVFISNDTLVFTKLNDISSMDDSVKIVYARVVTPKTMLKNNIQIGMKQSDFLNKIGLPLDKIGNKNINVIILETIVVGVWQSYYFSDDKHLDSIIITTDYVFQKL